MDLTYALVTVLIGQMIKRNKTWNTRDTEQPLGVAAKYDEWDEKKRERKRRTNDKVDDK